MTLRIILLVQARWLYVCRYLACTCSEEGVLNSLNELDQLRVLRISHGTVVVSDWVDPIQTV